VITLVADNLKRRLYTIGGLDYWTGLLDWTTGLLDSLHDRSFSALFTAELPNSRCDIELPKKPKCFRGYIFHMGTYQELPSKRLAT